MNNKGFAITTILYGIMILFCLLLVSLLSILSSYRKTQELLVEENNGARDIIGGKIDKTNGGDNTIDDGEDDAASNSSSSSSSSSSSPSSPSPSSSSSSSRNRVAITFNCNGGTFYGGSVAEITNTYIVGATIYLEDEEDGCAKGGITSNAWNTDPNATEGLKSFKVPDHNVTVYAVWK